MDETDRIPGTQLLGRAALLLRVVSEAMPSGIGTSAAARRAGLARPTAHRILAALAFEGFLDQDPASGHWLLGPELYVLGAVAGVRYDLTDLAAEHVRELARATGESAFFSVRRGEETVCLLREDGSFPIRSFVLYVGARFPLGVASAGLAILAFLPDEEIADYLAAARLESRFGAAHAVEPIRRRIASTRGLGYAVNPGLVVEGSWGMGAAVFDRAGRPAWALSLTGIERRFAEERRGELGALLLEHAHQLTRQIRAVAPPTRADRSPLGD